MKEDTPDDFQVHDLMETLTDKNMVEDLCAPVPPGFPNKISVLYERDGDMVKVAPEIFCQCTDAYREAVRAEVERRGWELFD